jgi:hypothetical protein
MRNSPRALLVAITIALIGLVSRVASASEGSTPTDPPPPSSSPRWDTSSLWIGPEWRLGASMHRTSLSPTLDVCRPYAKSCTHVTNVPRSALDGDHVDGTVADFGADVLGIGPLRLGIDLSVGTGDGPSTHAPSVPGVAGGWMWSQGGIDLGLRFRGDRWAAFTELTGGFITMNASVTGIKDADSLVANAGGYVVGARAGGGVLVTRWLSASAYVGGATGQVTDVSAGVRLEVRMDALVHVDSAAVSK